MFNLGEEEVEIEGVIYYPMNNSFWTNFETLALLYGLPLSLHFQPPSDNITHTISHRIPSTRSTL